MVMNKNISRLAQYATYAIPVAPAFFYGSAAGYEAFESMSAWSGSSTFSFYISVLISIIITIVTGVGFELVGIVSGEAAVMSFAARKYAHGMLASFALVVYVVLGIGGVMGFVLKVVAVFAIAPFAYMMKGLAEDLLSDYKREQRLIDDAYELESQEKKAELELKIEEKRMKLENKQKTLETNRQLKIVKAKKELESSGKVSESSKGKNRVSWRNLPDKDKEKVKGMTFEEVMKEYGQSRKTAKNWILYASGGKQGE